MNFSLTTIRRGTHNLFTERLEALHASKAGAYHKDELYELHIDIGALPEVLTSTPYKVELRTTDGRHDRLGRLIYFITEACFQDPNASPEMVAAAQKIRDEFIPTLDELTDSYATEAERALQRKPLLSSLGEVLKKFALPWNASQTLLDVATSFVEEGEKLNGLLNDRADVPRGVRAQALTLRNKAMAVLNRLRKDLQKEIARDMSLPRDLEHRVFGFFDTLHAMESAGRSNESTNDQAP